MKQHLPPGAARYQRIALDLTCGDLPSDTPVRLEVAGSSMEPTLRRGDTIVVQRTALTELRRGDILVVRRGQALVTHRLVLVDRRGWHLKGDAVRGVDQPVPGAAVVGLVIGRERGQQREELRRPLARALGRLRAELARARLLCAELRARRSRTPRG